MQHILGGVLAGCVWGTIFWLPRPALGQTASPRSLEFDATVTRNQSVPSEPIQRYIDPTGMSAAMLLAQAKVIAQAAANQFFAQNPAASQVKIYVFADYAGQFVPVLSSAIDRTSWQAQPNIDRYSRTFAAGVNLLSLTPVQRTVQPINASTGPVRNRDDIAFRDD